jgi:hypothetical protein
MIGPQYPLLVVRGHHTRRSFGRDRKTEVPCRSRCGTIKIHFCSKKTGLNFSPLPAMVMSSYLYVILKWDVKQYTTNQNAAI